MKMTIKKDILPLVALAGISTAPGALFNSGELDFGVILDDTTGDFELEAHVVNGVVDGVPTVDVEFEVSDLTVLAGPSLAISAPTNLPAAGVATGESLWILPQSNVSGEPYVAFASEELLDVGNGASDWTTNITFTLGTVTSPSGSGTFSVWTTDGVGTNTFFFSSTEPGLTDNSNQFESVFGHDHVNWGFNESGPWAVEITASGNHATFGDVSATETLTFNVIPEPSSTVLLSLAAMGLAARRRRK